MAVLDKRLHRPYLIGIGGVGMSALAAALQQSGADVSGSDRALAAPVQGRTLEKLSAMGVALHPQDGNCPDASMTAAVISTAVEEDNPDLRRVRALQIPVLHRSQALAALVQGQEVMAIAGTAGKTTVTGMLSYILSECGQDPGMVNGGEVLNWTGPSTLGNVRVGHSGKWVLEVDESDRSLLNFSPQNALITNISRDHYELQELYDMFSAFVQSIPGWVLTDAVTADQLVSAGCAPECFQIMPPGQLNVMDGRRFEWRGHACTVRMPGQHNMVNAAAALESARLLGVDETDAVAAMASFKGIHRRLETVGQIHGSTVLDDYAHNPAKISASWQAARSMGCRVLAVWRPHGFTPLDMMFDDLASCLRRRLEESDDRGFVLPVFYAGGTTQPRRTHTDLVDHINHPRLQAVEDYSTLEHRLRDETSPGDVILYMGARDPELTVSAERLVTASEQT